ncbi:MAG: phospho-N-acetylmuramoyl-pentapeptide-transferase, partial [Eubacteriales bacterium]|nr:phospho-N-acetylmuramoyl-pentapeptide-transferase [Eubacteriales bacterium]
LAVGATAAFTMTGFADDYLKAVKKNKNGLKPMQKIILQVLALAAFAVAALFMTDIGTSVYVPFFGIDVTLDLGLAYIPLIIIFMVFMTNAVNLTDGVDGLATGVSLITVIFLSAAVTLAGASGSGGIGWEQIQSFCTVVAGGCLGFLAFNLHPARVFMGDTGSLALGGALCSAAVLTRMPFVLLIAGGVYVAEALSVIIQVAVFKRTGKRVFRMAPLHHHFEISGWKENKVTAIFSLAALVLCALLIPALLP